jgi:hypothetical protein
MMHGMQQSRRPLLSAIATDAHFGLPVAVLILGITLLGLLK